MPRQRFNSTAEPADSRANLAGEANNSGPLRGDAMARRRYQRGSLFLRGTRELVWVGRWREDMIDHDGKTRRICHKEVLGSKHDIPTQKLALRELASRLAPINSSNYRALRSATFAQFAALWQANALTQHRTSTQAVVSSQLRKWLVPYFGEYIMKDIGGQSIQIFVQNCQRSPKTCRNLILTLRMMWNAAKAWGYVAHNPFDGLVLPKLEPQVRFFFTVDEIRRILETSGEPHKTFYWLAAETGMRAGELCGLRIEDIDLGDSIVSVKQSVWRGQMQSPKTANSVRKFAISPQLARRLRCYVSTWRPNPLGLVFATRAGKPWAPCNLMRSNLHPLLDSLGIQRSGLHAFRHSNGSLMDRLNAPMKTRQERLGHAAGSAITMAIYTHSVSEDDRTVADQIGNLLCPDVSNFAESENALAKEPTTVQ
jgi:integrase